jgi:hypothetical protein
MIQPELFSDSHQAFEYFRKVTSVMALKYVQIIEKLLL